MVYHNRDVPDYTKVRRPAWSRLYSILPSALYYTALRNGSSRLHGQSANANSRNRQAVETHEVNTEFFKAFT